MKADIAAPFGRLRNVEWAVQVPSASLHVCTAQRVRNFEGWDVEAIWFLGIRAASSVSRTCCCRPVAALERMRVTIRKSFCHHCYVEVGTPSGEGKGRCDDHWAARAEFPNRV